VKLTKEKQLSGSKNRKKKKAKERGKITDQAYKETRKRDKGKCALCGSKNGLECHHVLPRSRGGSGQPSNLIMLCKYHHYVKLHGQGDYDTKKRVLEYMINKGYDFEQELNRLEFRNKQRQPKGDNNE